MMFTCPEKDIHSIYIDGELPDEFRVKYEAHIQSCEKCRKELQKLTALRQLFQKDKEACGLSEKALDRSYEKLESRLSFRKITSFAEKKNVHKFNPLKFVVPAAAAAAVFALIIPMRMQNAPVSQDSTSITPIVAKASISTAPMAESNILVNGNISHEALEKMAEHNEQLQEKAPSSTISAYNILGTTVHYLDSASSAANRQIQKMSEALAAIDFFRPEVGDSQTAQISVTFPSVVSIPITEESLHQSE